MSESENAKYGHLMPVGGGDPIPLVKSHLRVGRRESCDIVLRFANVSAHHCELTMKSGYWFIKDLGSRYGTKVNGNRITEKCVEPGDVVSVAKHRYELKYSPPSAVSQTSKDFTEPKRKVVIHWANRDFREYLETV